MVIVPNHLLSNSDYHNKVEGYSSSSLKDILKQNNIIKGSQFNGYANKALTIGSYIHSEVLEPENTLKEFFIEKPGSVINVDSVGKQFLSYKDYLFCNKILGEMKLDENYKIIGSGGISELSFIDCILHGVKVKVRLDFLTRDRKIVDIKTTTGLLTEQHILTTIEKYGYDISAAFYIDVVKQFFNQELEFFLYFVSKKPICFHLYKVPNHLITRGRHLYKEALRVIKNNEHR